MLSLRRFGAAFATAAMMLLPTSSETSRRIVVADEITRRAMPNAPRHSAKRMGAGDFLTIDAAEAKRARKNAKRLVRGH